jgi:hypothetical protein
MGPRPPTEPRPFLLAFFSGVRGMVILRSSNFRFPEFSEVRLISILGSSLPASNDMATWHTDMLCSGLILMMLWQACYSKQERGLMSFCPPSHEKKGVV